MLCSLEVRKMTKIYCERPCKNYECEEHVCHAPKDLYVKKGIYPFCVNFIGDKSDDKQ